MYSQIGLVFRSEDGGPPFIAVHRVFMTLAGQPHSVSKYPVAVTYTDPEEAKESLRWMVDQIKEGEVLDYNAFPKVEDDFGEGTIEFPPVEGMPEQNADTSFSLH